MSDIFLYVVIGGLLAFAIYRAVSGTSGTSVADNLEKGEAFLAENKLKEGVQETDSGLQYLVLEEGSGSENPGPKTKVSAHYHGTLIDGTVFDSSVDRGEPAQFGLNQVISGWTEALQMMKIGAKWRLYVPSALAYGEQGAGGAIAPHTTLIFDVELLDIIA